jgi:hypothetical protein
VHLILECGLAQPLAVPAFPIVSSRACQQYQTIGGSTPALHRKPTRDIYKLTSFLGRVRCYMRTNERRQVILVRAMRSARERWSRSFSADQGSFAKVAERACSGNTRLQGGGGGFRDPFSIRAEAAETSFGEADSLIICRLSIPGLSRDGRSPVGFVLALSARLWQRQLACSSAEHHVEQIPINEAKTNEIPTRLLTLQCSRLGASVLPVNDRNLRLTGVDQTAIIGFTLVTCMVTRRQEIHTV